MIWKNKAGPATGVGLLLVAVKVDREECPDIDQVYMQVTQALTGRGGGPTTYF